ncbi:protein disulfide-isomerase A6 homolog [Planococcus citri]|uniref:protein disulfide-isomerase A6 homolog n=1 Tax=Planococcus citri TaxID=170843 RepID=UPI0031F9831E
MIVFLTVICCLKFVTALYTSGSDVVDLTDSNFESKVIDSNNVWIVEFYAPWCGHCQNFAPEYSKAASALKGVAKVGAVDADKYKSLAARFSISGFPTVKVFVDKKHPSDYNGPRSAKGIADAAVNGIREKVNSALSGGSEKSGKKTGSSDDVIELTDDNFDSLVLNSDDMWLIEFFAPWCGHCKNLAPHWAEAATQLKGKVKLGALDATVHSKKASEYGIQGYPTIKYFPSGKKLSSGSAEEYTGGRTANDIVTWALDKHTENLPPPEMKQITNEDVLKEACESHALCVIAVLPHILDCQSECRNGYLKTLKKVADGFKRKQWGWVWSEAGSQPELEVALEIGGFGYPAMALLNHKKMKYSILKGSFSNDGISEFLRDLSFGRGTTAAVKGASLPKVNAIEAWDGKDGELPQEEDIDLSDVNLNDEL